MGVRYINHTPHPSRHCLLSPCTTASSDVVTPAARTNADNAAAGFAAAGALFASEKATATAVAAVDAAAHDKNFSNGATIAEANIADI